MDIIYDIQNFLYSLFGVPITRFTGLQFIYFFIIPYILLTVSFYFVLKKIKLFRRSNAINWVLAPILAFFAIPFAIASFLISIPTGVFLVVLLSGERITLKRLIAAGVLAFIVWILVTISSAWLTRLFEA